MKNPTNHIFEFTPETLADWCEKHGMPRYRGAQVLEWVYQKGVIDPGAMTNLSKRDRELLAGEITFASGEVLRHQVATDGVQKLLVEWRDGETERRRDEVKRGEGAKGQRGEDQSGKVAEWRSGRVPGADAGAAAALRGIGEKENPPPGPLPPGGGIAERSGPIRATEALSAIGANEVAVSVAGDPRPPLPLPQGGGEERGGDPTRQTECVMIPTEDRKTACISSQIGCPVGCRFCASGIGGLDANLSAGRIVEQVWMLGRLEGVERISNVVFMGMGEPLANLSNVVPAIRTISSLWALGISARKITVSTVGLPKAIGKLAEQLDLPVTLALSLHAPNDEIRRQLIPWAEYTTIEELLGACRKWFERTGREITLEYTMLRGVNDRPEHARELAQLAKTLRANINLIRYNEVAGMPFERPRDEDVRAFQEVLRAKQVNAHIRASRGRDIAAACGQLRHETGSRAGKVPSAGC